MFFHDCNGFGFCAVAWVGLSSDPFGLFLGSEATFVGLNVMASAFSTRFHGLFGAGGISSGRSSCLGVFFPGFSIGLIAGEATTLGLSLNSPPDTSVPFGLGLEFFFGIKMDIHAE